MKTYIIADLKLFNDEQRLRMGYGSFAAMNNHIIRTWNSVVKPEDKVIVMGNSGEGTFEEMKEVISRLNGELTATSKHLNEKFTKDQWKEIGFSHFWEVSMFKDFEDGRSVIYLIKEMLEPRVYEDEYSLIVVDSENPIEGMMKGKLFSVDAFKWGYYPLDTEDLLNTYERMKEWESMEDGTETHSDIKEEGEI